LAIGRSVPVSLPADQLPDQRQIMFAPKKIKKFLGRGKAIGVSQFACLFRCQHSLVNFDVLMGDGNGMDADTAMCAQPAAPGCSHAGEQVQSIAGPKRALAHFAYGLALLSTFDEGGETLFEVEAWHYGGLPKSGGAPGL